MLKLTGMLRPPWSSRQSTNDVGLRRQLCIVVSTAFPLARIVRPAFMSSYFEKSAQDLSRARKFITPWHREKVEFSMSWWFALVCRRKARAAAKGPILARPASPTSCRVPALHCFPKYRCRNERLDEGHGSPYSYRCDLVAVTEVWVERAHR